MASPGVTNSRPAVGWFQEYRGAINVSGMADLSQGGCSAAQFSSEAQYEIDVLTAPAGSTPCRHQQRSSAEISTDAAG